MEREAVLRQKIERLKRDRAAMSLPKPSLGIEGETSPKSAPQAGSRGGHVTEDNAKPPDAKKEKASLFYELISVRVGAFEKHDAGNSCSEQAKTHHTRTA